MGLKSLISPSNVAVLGASNRVGSVGNAVMTNILSGGFNGRVFPVNPSSDTILGMNCYRSILDIEHQVDLAIIITPSKVVPHVMEECGKKGVIYGKKTVSLLLFWIREEQRGYLR